MLTLLSKIFIRNRTDYEKPAVRSAYGALCGGFGIFLNLLLFAGKLAAGMLAKSVAITADAFNNLSDAGSSVITLLGFKLAGQKPDPEHPFGHGRIEYISGLLVSAAIILMGFELLKSSIDKILNPAQIEFSPTVIVILAVSVFIKLYMAVYNRKIGRKISSAALLAASTDSLSDSVATSVVLVSTVVSQVLPSGTLDKISFDGWCGLLVSMFVLYSGIMSIKDTVSPLLGQTPNAEFVKRIERIVLSYDGITAVHDLIVHDYGPERVIISLHAEMPTTEHSDIFKMHDIVNSAENQLRDELGCDATIHLDPIVIGDTHTDELKAQTLELLNEIDSELTLHDFRISPTPTHTKLIFDVVVPYDFRLSDEQVRARICDAVSSISIRNDEVKKYSATITIDRPYS
ncbi:MAG: cation transporter [Christensenellaceae bacterium]|nr:cation transporter [Christensenellaceae bacterium]